MYIILSKLSKTYNFATSSFTKVLNNFDSIIIALPYLINALSTFIPDI